MTTYSPLIVGVFHKEPDAKHAINALRAAGFDRHQIGLALREGGVVTSSLLDDLVKLGVPQDRASYYDNEYRLGNAIVSVRADGREHEAMDILHRYGAYGLQGATMETASTPHSPTEATTGPTGTATGPTGANARPMQATTGPTGPREIRPGEEHAIQLHQEELQAEKERVQTGEVRVYKETVSEVQSINVPVTHEEVYIERRPVTEGQASETPLGQEEVIRVPVTEEQVIITKRPVVTGEVTIGKREVEENLQYTDTVQHEEARLEHEGQTRVRTNEDVDTPLVDDKTRARQHEKLRRRKGSSDV